MPFEALSKIRGALTRGVQRLVASRLLTGLRGAALRSFTIRRAPELPPAAVTTLVNHSTSIRVAGEEFRFKGPGEELPIERIPVNPFLFGDDALGRRFRFDANVFHEPTGQTVRVGVIGPTNPTINELAADAFFTAAEIFKYERFGIPNPETTDMLLLDIISAERQF